MRRLALLSAWAILLVVPSGAAAERWRWPVDGPLVERFHVLSDRFAAGQHRGIDIAAARGTPVASACEGTVTFAGTAGTSGRTVSIACGRLTATYLHLDRIDVHRGQSAAAGSPVGTVGTSGLPAPAGPQLHFGVHLSARRRTYVDPLSVLSRAAGTPPVALPPIGRPRIGGRLSPLGPPTLGSAPLARLAPVARSAAPLVGPAVPAPGDPALSGVAASAGDARQVLGPGSGLPLEGLWVPAASGLLLLALLGAVPRALRRHARGRAASRPAPGSRTVALRPGPLRAAD